MYRRQTTLGLFAYAIGRCRCFLAVLISGQMNAARVRLLTLHKGMQHTLHNPCETYARLLWLTSRAQQSLESSADQALRIASVTRYMLITGRVTRPSIGCGERVTLCGRER